MNPSFSANYVTFEYQEDLSRAVFSNISGKGDILHDRAEKSSKATDKLHSI